MTQTTSPYNGHYSRDMIKELREVLDFTRNNPGIAYSFPGVFRATLEYIQFLCNDVDDIVAIHKATKHIRRNWGPKSPTNEQRRRLNDFCQLIGNLADAIETDGSGHWGDISPTSNAEAYRERRTFFEDRVKTEWKTLRLLPQAAALVECWTIN